MKSIAIVSAICCFQSITGASGLEVPVLSDLDTALTILKEEDFWAQYSTKNASAILIESPRNYNAAYSTCLSLSESLWSPEAQNFRSGVNNSLAYQVHLGKFPSSQLFWVAPYAEGDNGCRAIDLAGKVDYVNCNEKRPVLCSHSGALSNYTYQDTSPQYQITLPVRNQLITGFRDAYGWRFDGIRYAPTPRRFEHSTVLDARGSVTALKFGDVCIQNSAWRGVPATGSEDCLFLNVATPFLPGKQTNKKDLKPVLFWIHGGGYVENSGNIRNYDGVAMAARGDIVVVKINYRLGNFGWLAINGTSITGNYGLGDMVTALKWVHENIAAFGGDPERITIGGGSAGAASVKALIASKAVDGLFKAGIMESLPVGYFPNGRFARYSTIDEATAYQGLGVLHDTGCNASPPGRYQASCLKNVPADVLNHIPTTANIPVIDNVYLFSKDWPMTSGPGYMAHVPVMIGNNRDESAINWDIDEFKGNPSSSRDWLSFASQSFPASLDGKSINITDFADNTAFAGFTGFNLTSRITSDASFICGATALAYSTAKHHTLPAVYHYNFYRTYQPVWWSAPQCVPPITPGHPLGDPSKEYYKCHSGEEDYALGILLYSGEEPRDTFDIPFQQLIVDYWTSFIRTNDPNPDKEYLKIRGYWSTLNQIEKSGQWEKFDSTNPRVRILEWNGRQASLEGRERCSALGLPLDYYETRSG
ncbi:Acetylcholinesterase [Arthrobotrys entomopaga]|nr:Acetylcholinesterase [Arthrobotrys entomopaga]